MASDLGWTRPDTPPLRDFLARKDELWAVARGLDRLSAEHL